MAEGFYIFTYSFDGPLVSHAKLHHLFGRNLDQIFAALERSEDGLVRVEVPSTWPAAESIQALESAGQVRVGGGVVCVCTST